MKRCSFMGKQKNAWFASNNTVTAGDMSITAQMDSAMLLISEKAYATSDSADGYSTALTMSTGNTATDLKLITPTNLGTATTAATLTWGEAHSTDPAASQGNKQTAAISNVAGYVLQKDVYLKMATGSQPGSNLKLSNVTVTKGSNTIANSFRVLAFVDGAASTYQTYNTGTTTLSTGVLASTVANNASTCVHLMIYFDGTDDSAYTNNATDLTEVKVNFEFTVDDPLSSAP